MPARESDPLTGFMFSLDAGGKVQGFFTEISGLGSETEVVEHKVVDPSGRDLVQKIPGRLKFTDVTLKRGVTKTVDMWDWRKKVEDGDIVGARTNASITMFDQSLTPVASWELINVWPSKISGPQMQSDSTAYGIEEMTLVFEDMKRVKM
ncbi:MAG: phage tail protein [Chloroflexi bacterium]|nr:phage tail protein [Dehalococcoidia bacterium]MCO5200327.1 phage tail protein [Chloroflexota bacterium]MCZ7576112.1 phage tail protein [Dehalococcoidia bacterium]NJD64310.1 phage tail protein [Chloroflexota bacterium]PWB47707.1 MAG: phage tail protein [Dehalococcoidia bacterium]